MKKLGLIGFGRFGQLIYRHIHNGVHIQVYDPFRSEDQSLKSIHFVNLKEVCNNPFIMLAVPVGAMESVTNKMSEYVPNKTVVMDVCAVKQYPINIMLKNFNSNIQILGSHPLFGPDSAKYSLKDHLIIMTPARISDADFRNIKEFWQQFGIKIIEMSPEEQDKLMAWTLALTHFLGRGLNGLPLPDTVVSTKDYQNLVKLMKKINRDTWELFHDMHRFNPFTKEMREMLLQSMKDLKTELDQIDVYGKELE